MAKRKDDKLERQPPGLMPVAFFQNLPFWGDLKVNEQKILVAETQALKEQMVTVERGRLGMAQHLRNLKELLEGRGYWLKYLKSLHQSYRTSYRMVDAYKTVEKELPPPVIEGAIVRGMEMIGLHTPERPFGKYTEAIRRLPPPKNIKDGEVGAWLDQIEQLKKTTAAVPRDKTVLKPDLAEKIAFVSARRAWKALSGATKARHIWAVRLLGKLMTEFGLPAQRIEPEAVPEEYRRGSGYPKGRPRKQAGEGADEK